MLYKICADVHIGAHCNELHSVEQIMEVADCRFLQQFKIQIIVSTVSYLM